MALLSLLGWMVVALVGVFAHVREPREWRHPATLSTIGTLFSRISHGTPIVCLWLPSASRFYTVCDQAPGSTSHLSFISDAAVFPDLLLLRDRGSDLLRLLREGLSEQWPGAGRVQERSQTCCCRCGDCGPGASASQRKFAPSCGRSVSGTMANHNTHVAPGFTPNDPVLAPVNVVVLPGPPGSCLWGTPQPLPDVLPAGEPTLPCGPKNPGLRSAPGDSSFSPEHLQTVWGVRSISTVAELLHTKDLPRKSVQ
ncbi:uncharacterized protein LOC109491637 isoform X2 [Felis catus]|uniref:uncharacterized protein LOC109491637 isoform X2 n=1 Tax=Felis catus TaxID=9685 RepID=UPI001D1A0762|nr:uncharacterized protein LOC109491637 isoform X2 [Felis catus]